MTTVKPHGALLARSRLLGTRFHELFTDERCFRVSRRAIDCAGELKQILHKKGCTFFHSWQCTLLIRLLAKRRNPQSAKKHRLFITGAII